MTTEPTTEGIVAQARSLLRDFPQFFEVDLGGITTSTVRLPHPNVDGSTLQVYFAPEVGAEAVASESVVLTPVDKADWRVDERNGLLKFNNTNVLGKQCIVAGYYYEWFVDEDLSYYADSLVSEHLHGRDIILDNVDLMEVDVIAMGTVARALWSLVTQFSTEINVQTPEGMNIPAGQRFQQVWSLFQHWESEYARRAGALNVGIGALRVFQLRRVSKQTNRFVPVYVPREYDDPRPPRRVLPPIQTPLTTTPTNVPATIVDPAYYTVEEIAQEGRDLGFGGWRTIGTSGFIPGTSGELG